MEEKIEEERIMEKRYLEVWHRLCKNKIAILGLVILSIFIFLAVFADVIANYDSKVIAQDVTSRLQPPSKEHWFGTDGYGRDIFARIIHGTRITLFIAFTTTAISAVAGGILGMAAGFYGGVIDNVIMRIVDTVMCLPPLLFSLSIVAALGTGMRNLIIAVSFTMTPYFARVIRATAISVVSMDYIEASKSLGSSNIKTIIWHVLPNSIGPIIVQATMNLSYMIMLSAGLSFIGLGIQPPAPEWGAMLSEGREFMRYSPYIVAFPGLAIVLTALSLNLLGDGLRDALDPKLNN